MKLKLALLPIFGVTSFALNGITSAQITSGNLVVERVGTGSGALTSASTAVFIDQFNTTTTGQSTVNTITVPTAGTARLTISGTATSEGLVTVSPNGLSLAVAGYDAATGVLAINGTASSANNRVANIIATDGTVTRGGGTSTVFTSNNIRSAITNGTDIWAVGANTGVYNLTNSTVVSSTVTNARQISIFAGSANGQLYLSTGSGTQGIYSVGSGTPTTTGQTATVMITTNALGGGTSPYGFSINTSKNVAYVADSSAGISKYTSSNGGTTWIRNGTYANTISGSLGTTGLTVDWSNSNAPVVFASSPTTLYKLVDTGGTGAANYGTATSLATAATNTVFRGVQLGVLPSVWTNSNGNTNGSLNLVTATAATQYSNFSTILANDSNLAFQNVNSGAGAQALNLINNTSLSSVSSINFKSGGFGTNSANTSYTLGGSGLTLTGIGSTSAIGSFIANSANYTSVISNNSGITQEVGMPLTLGAANQAFRASSGDLAINGIVANGGNTLTVGGAANMTFSSSAVISGGGGLNKVEAGTLTLDGNNIYTGATDVKAGKLVVTDTIGSSAVIVSGSGAVLASDTVATIGSTLAIHSGAILAVGDAANASTATATVIGATTFNNDSIFSWDIDNAGTSYDKLVTSSLLDGDAVGGAVFRIVAADATFASMFWKTSQTWTDIFTNSGSAGIDNWATIFGNSVSLVDNNFNSITPVGGSFSVSGSTLTWTAVPEPSSALAGLLITAGLLRRRRVA